MIAHGDDDLASVVWDTDALADRLNALADGLERHGFGSSSHQVRLWAYSAYQLADGLRHEDVTA